MKIWPFLYGVFIFSFFFCSFSKAQELKRKAQIGIAVVEINDSIAKSISYKGNGILVVSVKENTTASIAGIKANDVIIRINNKEIKTKNDFQKLSSELREGDMFEVEIYRDKKTLHLKSKAIPKPFEKSNCCDVIYDKIAWNNGLLRLITLKPEQKEKMPAVLFIPGYMCYSLDNIPNHPYGALCEKMAAQGFVVVRVEKPGEGDNLNTPDCKTIGFNDEVSAFERGIDYIKTLDFVDTNNIFIWGHSLGGIEAPVIASRKKVKGIVVYGTAISTWFEYILAMFRFQNPLSGVDYVENEALIRKSTQLLYEYLIQKKAPFSLSKDSTYQSILSSMMEYDGNRLIWKRDYTFWQELQDINIPECLKKSACFVLSCWGEYDIEAFSEWEHQEIARIVNKYYPGKGTFMKFPQTTHAFAKVASIKEGIENRSLDFIMKNFNNDVIDKTCQWMKNVVPQN